MQRLFEIPHRYFQIRRSFAFFRCSASAGVVFSTLQLLEMMFSHVAVSLLKSCVLLASLVEFIFQSLFSEGISAATFS